MDSYNDLIDNGTGEMNEGVGEDNLDQIVNELINDTVVKKQMVRGEEVDLFKIPNHLKLSQGHLGEYGDWFTFPNSMYTPVFNRPFSNYLKDSYDEEDRDIIKEKYMSLLQTKFDELT